MTVGSRIKNLRTMANMSQVELSERIHVSKQTLYKYENDIITNIPSDKIELIAKVFSVTPAMIMGWRDDSEEQLERFTSHEKELVHKYRAAPEGIQESVCKLLDVKYSEKKDASGSSADMLA